MQPVVFNPSEFIGTIEQLQQIERLSKREKISFIEGLTPRQRRDLSKEQIAFFYLEHLEGVAKAVNGSHYEKTLQEIPPFPTGDASVSLYDLIMILDQLEQNDKPILLQKLRTYCEIDTAQKLREGSVCPSRLSGGNGALFLSFKECYASLFHPTGGPIHAPISLFRQKVLSYRITLCFSTSYEINCILILMF